MSLDPEPLGLEPLGLEPLGLELGAERLGTEGPCPYKRKGAPTGNPFLSYL